MVTGPASPAWDEFHPFSPSAGVFPQQLCVLYLTDLPAYSWWAVKIILLKQSNDLAHIPRFEKVQSVSLFRVCAYLLSHVRLFRDPIDCGPPGSSVHGILQARILEWVAIPFSRGSF